MIITNQFNLPQSMVDACRKNYSVLPNEYRVTSLLNGVKETLLLRRHDHKITMDVSEMIWAIFGTAVHDIFRRQEESPDYFKEERLYCKFGDYMLSGQFDEYHIDNEEINDFKITSVYKIKLGNFNDWRMQQLMYASLLKHHSINANKGKVTALLRDWTPWKAKHEADYPQLQVHVENFTFEPDDMRNIDCYIITAFEVIDEWQDEPDDAIPACSSDQRWYSGEKFAVMKNKNKRASRLCDSELEAGLWIDVAKEKDKKKHSYRIEHRPGENKKCLYYCKANQFCNFYQTLREG